MIQICSSQIAFGGGGPDRRLRAAMPRLPRHAAAGGACMCLCCMCGDRVYSNCAASLHTPRRFPSGTGASCAAMEATEEGLAAAAAARDKLLQTKRRLEEVSLTDSLRAAACRLPPAACCLWDATSRPTCLLLTPLPQAAGAEGGSAAGGGASAPKKAAPAARVVPPCTHEVAVPPDYDVAALQASLDPALHGGLVLVGWGVPGGGGVSLRRKTAAEGPGKCKWEGDGSGHRPAVAAAVASAGWAGGPLPVRSVHGSHGSGSCSPPSRSAAAPANPASAAAAGTIESPKWTGAMAKEYPHFTLDPFQSTAIACIERRESVLVAAHTSGAAGAGGVDAGGRHTEGGREKSVVARSLPCPVSRRAPPPAPRPRPPVQPARRWWQSTRLLRRLRRGSGSSTPRR